MCKWGIHKKVKVKIPSDLSCSGDTYFKDMLIDKCIVELVSALQTAGIDMRGSCCGHGKTFGHIELQDGRVLMILPDTQTYHKIANI